MPEHTVGAMLNNPGAVALRQGRCAALARCLVPRAQNAVGGVAHRVCHVSVHVAWAHLPLQLCRLELRQHLQRWGWWVHSSAATSTPYAVADGRKSSKAAAGTTLCRRITPPGQAHPLPRVRQHEGHPGTLQVLQKGLCKEAVGSAGPRNRRAVGTGMEAIHGCTSSLPGPAGTRTPSILIYLTQELHRRRVDVGAAAEVQHHALQPCPAAPRVAAIAAAAGHIATAARGRLLLQRVSNVVLQVLSAGRGCWRGDSQGWWAGEEWGGQACPLASRLDDLPATLTTPSTHLHVAEDERGVHPHQQHTLHCLCGRVLLPVAVVVCAG